MPPVPKADGSHKTHAAALYVTVYAEDLTRWRKAAGGSAIRAWVWDVLDRAASKPGRSLAPSAGHGRRSEVLYVECDPAQKERWRQASQREGYRTLSHWVEGCLNYAVCK